MQLGRAVVRRHVDRDANDVTAQLGDGFLDALGVRPFTATRAPLLASPSAMANPMPCVDPVT